VSAAAGTALHLVLYEGAGASPLEPTRRYGLLRLLLDRGYRVSRSLRDAAVQASRTGMLLVLGRFEDPAAAQGVASESPAGALLFRDIGELGEEQVLEIVEGAGSELQARRPGGWKPWFPVIDYDRCTNCMQCLSFCLFDVYGVDDNRRIRVQNQSNCKTDCPACSRVCPEVAILFPKYRSGPINGDEINEVDLRREGMKVDISALLGGDIYALLRERSAKAKSRFSKERDEGRALKERQRCLAKLQEALDIPPELLAALPSAEQIQTRAEEAAARGSKTLGGGG
jgi:NAD-dependent dihydropyrimidine dehydrogenase PreA subunit